MRYAVWLIPVFGLFLLISCRGQSQKELNILDFGAVPDGKTMNTQAIQSTIDKALKSKGKVIIPKGTFLTGALTLGPDITLQIDEGATLLASPNMKDYPERHFISAPYADSLIIKGKGTINGNGTAFYDKDWKFTERPQPWIVISDAKGVSVTGIHFENSPSHTLNFNFCDGVTVDSISIKNNPQSPNTDGIDIRNTRNIAVTNADIRTGDDAICLKVTSKADLWHDPKGNPRPRTVENVLVKHCYLESDDSALKLGTGSGHFTENIVFEDITIRKTRYAMALFMMDGGVYRDILFKDIDAETGARHAQEYGIFIDIHQRKEDSPVGQIENIRFEDCSIATNGIFYMSGHPAQMIDDIQLENVNVTFMGHLDNSSWKKPKGNKKIKQWASTSDFVREKGKFILADAKKVRLKNVTFNQVPNDSIPLFWKHNVSLDTLNVKIIP
ncbi:glycoside hydrolase family 28 protein [Flagellimonas sp. S174]|uniref:glycoside hydrolase family 28 protein n=1 Tax=Flagellimonas sp. S174 TaxID=3410790 RepID=UPI002637F0A2|nr:glycosyl hydrolase family 28 protein [uncultured Allomuricauda sp.]